MNSPFQANHADHWGQYPADVNPEWQVRFMDTAPSLGIGPKQGIKKHDRQPVSKNDGGKVSGESLSGHAMLPPLWAEILAHN
jgi:hypothetical protein